jgi:hypothetical protein
MRVRLLPPPSRAQLMERALHVIIRDYPESLEVLREHFVPIAGVGDRSLSEIEGGDAVIDGLVERMAWRPAAESPKG